ncbi:MAG: hypothetical protein WD021_03210 [Rhodothermales bacterium]
MSGSVEKTPDHRQRVATLLALLAGEKSQEVLARHASRERVAYELTRVWFDEIYVPGGRYLGGLKGDFSRASAETFNDAFDPVEIAAMERFHRFFELRVEMLPGDFIEAERIPIDERWRSLMRDAGYLLEDLGIDVGDRGRRLASSLQGVDGLASLIRSGG